MKKNYLFAVVLGATVLAGCSQDEQLEIIKENQSNFTGILELSNSRTTLGDDNKVNWVENEDYVSIFEKDDQNTQYKVKSVSNGKALFEFVNYIEKENPVALDYNYSIYPYSDENSISAEGVISAKVPATINDYSGKDDAINKALMVAKSETTDLKYSNAQGILLLRLNAQKPNNYGAIKSIKLTSTKYNLAGTATMSWANNVEKPEAKITGDDGTKELTLILATELQNELPKSSSGEYEEYYIPVVPTEFKKNEDGTGDVTMTITWTSNQTYEKNIGIDFTISRNKIKPLKHTIGTQDFTGVIDQVVYKVDSNEELANLNGKSGIASLSNNLSSDNEITFKGQLQAEGEVTLDGNNNTFVLGTPSDYGIVANGIGNQITIDETNVDSKGGGIGAVNGGQVIFNSGSVAVNTTNTSGRYNFYAVGDGTVVTINGGEFSFSKRLNQKRAYIYCGSGATVNVKGGTFGAASTRSGYTDGILGEGTIVITGGTFGFDPSKWVAEGYKAVKDGTIWSVLSNDIKDVSSTDELATAVQAGTTNLYLKSGEYTMSDVCKGKTLTISGSQNTVITVVPAGQGEANGQLDYSLDGSTVTFNNVTIKTNSQLYAGYARLSATYNDCVIQNTYNLGVGNSEFNKCVFNITNEYLRVGGAYEAVFNNCTFNTEGRAILVFQDGTTNNQTVTIKNCTFNASAAAQTWNGIHVAAVSYDGSQGGTYIVNFEGNNVVDDDFNGLWQIKNGEQNVTVNGLN